MKHQTRAERALAFAFFIKKLYLIKKKEQDLSNYVHKIFD